ncbi:hydantoinase/oxoprolinase family protein [Bacillus sp. FJAT-29814]|uniref:hydantoinase/oxoprolinase family protein n=1 Tax=Bacillus sp. FJAT-29814 TaxID=1729688 RepID=UPI000829A956|nr:hydantoinase/oxoprolinase family protein [Bacillus sp. FJAT-29814]
MSYMVGVDVGGTFTDVTLVDSRNGKIKNHKVSSTPDDPSRAIMKGIKEILELNDIAVEDVHYLAHGTTVATNALIERKGAVTGLIVTKGFRDLLEIGRQTRPSLYNFFEEKPAPIIPGNLRFEANERLMANGEVYKVLDDESLHKSIDALKEQGVKSVAICFLFSYLNPEHEKKAVETIKERFPEAYVSASHEIVPEFREYSRLSTTALNAYLGPVMKNYMENFLNAVKEYGIPAEPYITQSNGGIISIQESVSSPLRTAVSGPAAGVVAAKNLAELTGYKNMITFDMGGTSADFSLIENGEPKISMEREVEGFPARIPMLDIHACGAGGGSIAYIDNGGALKVGPESAGSTPGPASYGRGGTKPTVTDANLLLGRLNPKEILGGRMTVDREAAERAIKEHICKHSNLTLEEATAGIISVVNANMSRAIRLISIQKGHDPRDFTLVSFGGAGGLHCSALAKELNIPRVLIPPSPGTFCSLGLLVTDVRTDYVRSSLHEATPENMIVSAAIFEELKEEGLKLLEKENISESKRKYELVIDMRFKGQNYEIPIPVEWDELNPFGFAAITNRFQEQHEKVYGYSKKDGVMEFVNFRLTAVGQLPKAEFEKADTASVTASPIATRPVYFTEVDEPGYYETKIFVREDLKPGNKVQGPLIVEQMDTTILVLPEQSMKVDEYGNLIIYTFGEEE